MNIKQKLILAFAVIASLPVILVAVLIILSVHEVLHRADHDRVVSRHWDGADTPQSNCGRGLAPDSGGSVTDKLTVPPPSGASPLPQSFVCGLGRHGQGAHLAVAVHQWPGVLLGHDEVLKLWEGACPR